MWSLPLLVVLRLGCFTFNGIMPPLLPSIGQSLHFSLALTAQLAAMTALAWGLGGVAFTPLAGRLKTKHMVVIGSLLMGIFSLLSGMTSRYGELLLFRFLGGLAGGAVGPTSQVYLMNAFHGRTQLRAIGWVTAGYSLGGVVFVPLLLVLASFTGWRGPFVAVAAFFALLAMLLAIVLHDQEQQHGVARVASGYGAQLWSAIRTRETLGALMANLVERSGNSAVVTFLPVMLIVRFGLTDVQVAPLVSIFSAAAALGAVVGGSRGIRGRDATAIRATYVVGLLVAVPIVGLVYWWTPTVAVVVVSATVYALVDAYVRPSYLSLLGNVAHPASTMGWNAMGNQLGSTLGTSIPAVIVSSWGYEALGFWGSILTAAAAVTMGWSGRSIATSGPHVQAG